VYELLGIGVLRVLEYLIRQNLDSSKVSIPCYFSVNAAYVFYRVYKEAENNVLNIDLFAAQYYSIHYHMKQY